jgi:TolB protein
MTLGSNERPRRVTFTGSYNARPRISPDGKQLAVLTLDQGAYRIGVQDLGSGSMQILSQGRQDESPSFAPNGAMLILAGRERGKGVLQTISIDGQTSSRLQADAGEVREPVWGPFLP